MLFSASLMILALTAPVSRVRENQAWVNFTYDCAVRFNTNRKMMIKMSLKTGEMKYVDEAARYDKYAQYILKSFNFDAKSYSTLDYLSDQEVDALQYGPEGEKTKEKARFAEFNADLDVCRAAIPEAGAAPSKADPADHKPECAANYQAMAQVILRSTQASRTIDDQERGRRTMLWSKYAMRAVQMDRPGGNLTHKLPEYIQTAADKLADAAMGKGDAGIRHIVGAVGACDSEFKLTPILLQ